MKNLFLILAVVLSGCVSTEIVNTSKNTVIVRASIKSPEEAQSLADGECGKYQKSASLNQFIPANSIWGNYFFNCEAK